MQYYEPNYRLYPTLVLFLAQQPIQAAILHLVIVTP